MIKQIKAFFEEKILVSTETEPASQNDNHRLAAAALMLEVAKADYEDQPEELQAIKELIKQSFHLSADETEQLLQQANTESEMSTSDYDFVSVINGQYTQNEKNKLIENLWQIAYADGVLSEYEEHLIRRLAGLLYVSHADFIQSKLRVSGEL